MSLHSTIRSLSCLLAIILVLASCSEPESIVAPGPGDDETTTTTVAQDIEEDGDEGNGDDEVLDGDVETSDETSTTTTQPADSEPDAGVGSNDADEPVDNDEATSAPETFVVDETLENSAAFVGLAESGLALTLEEQSCADETAVAAVNAGESELDAVIDAVKSCASPVALDDFASDLIIAGGDGLPADEAACVSSQLQSGDEYQSFWAVLLADEAFDFLTSGSDAQNRYLDLYTECVSTGRAVADEAEITLSAPSVGCIDDLYLDQEFVRITIEADLSGNLEDQQRVANQIGTCLTADEQQLLGAG